MDETVPSPEADPAEKHRIPVIDRMMEVLSALEWRPNGTAIRELVDMTGMPRTTIYRIVNTLQSHDMVRRSPGGTYTLGPRLLSLSSRVAVDSPGYDLSALALPFLEQLSEETGESSKVSVYDKGTTLVLVAASGKREYALMVTPGQSLPLHAGAASKVLLAHLPREEREAVLRAPLQGFTGRTFADPLRLTAELAKIARRGWSMDRGEFSPSVHAFGAPVLDSAGRCVGAVSVPFLAGAEPERMEAIRRRVIATATAIGAVLPVKPRPAGAAKRPAG